MNMSGKNLTLMEIQAAEIRSLKEEFEIWKSGTKENMDNFFLITMSIIIYLMQGGFAFLEAGAVRSRNTTNILFKNLLDSFVSALSFWLLGYAFAFGKGNAFIGYSVFAHDGLEDSKIALWFFHFVFAATAATIVSGAVAERCDFVAYLVYSVFLTGFIYPVIAHWAWSEEGWLSIGLTSTIGAETIQVSYMDFAGSGIVHAHGGIAAFCGAAFLGPRIGRFDEKTGKPKTIKGHSVPLTALGGFILVFGFFAFNGSSQGSISNIGDGIAVSTAVKNTAISASGGAFVTLAMNKTKWFGTQTWSLLTTLNGSLTGMVAVCSSVNQVTTYSAFVIGCVSGLAYLLGNRLVLNWAKVDDPLDATAVHLFGGAWGVLATGFFGRETGIFYHWDQRSGLQLAWQLIGLLAICAWTAAICVLMFGILKLMGILRVSAELEEKGLDIPKHGEDAYPLEAYGHGWREEAEDIVQGILKAAAESPETVEAICNLEINHAPNGVKHLNKDWDSNTTVNTDLTDISIQHTYM